VAGGMTITTEHAAEVLAALGEAFMQAEATLPLDGEWYEVAEEESDPRLPQLTNTGLGAWRTTRSV
jgi:hypothetical protein